MRPILILWLTLINLNIFCQDTTYIYFDSDWKKTSKEESKYYRKVFKNEDRKWEVLDFYANGQLQMHGFYKNKKLTKEDGKFTYYYKNGQVKRYEEYFNGKENGNWQYYFENGNLDMKGTFDKGDTTGLWIWYFESGEKCAEEIYVKDSRIKYHYWDKKGHEVQFIDANYKASFPGGDTAFINFVKNNTEYPKEALARGIYGRVIIKIEVNEKGKIEEVSVFKSAHPLLDKAALETVKKFPDFMPGKMHNRFESFYFMAPFKFSY